MNNDKLIEVDPEILKVKLEKLAKTKVTVRQRSGLNLELGCYEMHIDSPPEEGAEYICLACGEKTIHDKPEVDNVEKLRRYVQYVETYGYSVELEEKYFCAHCDKDENKAPKTYLVIHQDNKRFKRLLSSWEEYTCPACGEESINEPHAISSAEKARDYIQYIRKLGYNFELVEKDFCFQCSSGIVVDPKLKLIINYKNKVHITDDFSADELYKLYLFLHGQTTYKYSDGEETSALNKLLPRIVEILGLKDSDIEQLIEIAKNNEPEIEYFDD